jgi:hypothetical protein
MASCAFDDQFGEDDNDSDVHGLIHLLPDADQEALRWV